MVIATTSLRMAVAKAAWSHLLVAPVGMLVAVLRVAVRRCQSPCGCASPCLCMHASASNPGGTTFEIQGWGARGATQGNASVEQVKCKCSRAVASKDRRHTSELMHDQRGTRSHGGRSAVREKVKSKRPKWLVDVPWALTKVEG